MGTPRRRAEVTKTRIVRGIECINERESFVSVEPYWDAITKAPWDECSERWKKHFDELGIPTRKTAIGELEVYQRWYIT